MSIGVWCEPCAKSYQVRDEMAGRKGKCPQGHPITVPAAAETIVEENDFAFTAGAAPKAKVAAAAAVAEEPAGDDFGFPDTGPVAQRSADREPASGKHARKHTPRTQKAARGDTDGKKPIVPVLIGSGIGLLGFVVGVALYFMGQSGTGPLRDQAEAAEKKAADLDLKLKQSQAETAAEKEATRKAAAASAKNPETAAALARALSAEKKLADYEKKAAETVAAAPADAAAKGKEMAKEMAKEEAKSAIPNLPDEKSAPIPKGKTWSAPPTADVGQVELKAGDKLVLTPKDDAVIKAAGGKLTVKFKFTVPAGKTLPGEVYATAFVIQQIDNVSTRNVKVKLGKGEGEAVFDFGKTVTGKAEVVFTISDNKSVDNGKMLTVHGSLLKLQAEF